MKKDHDNEFIGSKNGGREVWVGLERQKNGEILQPKVAAAAAFAGPIWDRPTAVRRDFWPARSPYLALPPWKVCVHGRWPKSSPTAKTRLA